MKLTATRVATHADRTEWAVKVNRANGPRRVYEVTAYPDGELCVCTVRRPLSKAKAPKLYADIALLLAQQS